MNIIKTELETFPNHAAVSITSRLSCVPISALRGEATEARYQNTKLQHTMCEPATKFQLLLHNRNCLLLCAVRPQHAQASEIKLHTSG